MKIQNLKLKSILTVFCSCLIALTVIFISIYSYLFYKKSMTKKIAESRIDVLNQISDKVHSIYNSCTIISNFYYYNLSLTKSYHSDSGFSPEQRKDIVQNLENIDRSLRETVKATDLNYEYVIAMDNGYSFASNGENSAYSFSDYQNRLWYSKLKAHKNEPLWVSTYKDSDSAGTYIISVVRALLDDNGNIAGVFLLSIPESAVYSTYSQMIHDNNIYIIDGYGNIVSHKNKDMLGINFYDMNSFSQMFGGGNNTAPTGYRIVSKSGRKFLFSIFQSKELNWVFVEEIPLQTVLADVLYLKRFMLIISAVIIILAILFTAYVSDCTTRPLAILLKQMEKVGHSADETDLFDVSGWEEINRICDECNFMSQRIKNLVKESKAAEREKARAELGFMQAQMSPYYLYNTLFSIRCLVDMGDGASAKEAIDAFSSILKYILSYKSEFVTIAKEIEFLENYTKLQKILYGEKFNVSVSCSEDLYSSRILRMILQPLVENSLLHGISENKQNISVNVSFMKDGKALKIEVIDDGVGFNNLNLERLYQHVDKVNETKSTPHSNMIGMNNIRQRISTYFGKPYGLSIDTTYESGARVVVSVPYIA